MGTRIEHRYTGGDFYAINPKGYVPTLQFDDGQVLTEGAAILQHLGDIAPTKGLIPVVGTMERARVVEWLTFTGTELHKTFPLLWQPDTPEAVRAKAMDLLRRRIAYVNGQLKGRAYLVADNFSVADA